MFLLVNSNSKALTQKNTSPTHFKVWFSVFWSRIKSDIFCIEILSEDVAISSCLPPHWLHFIRPSPPALPPHVSNIRCEVFQWARTWAGLGFRPGGCDQNMIIEQTWFSFHQVFSPDLSAVGGLRKALGTHIHTAVERLTEIVQRQRGLPGIGQQGAR